MVSSGANKCRADLKMNGCEELHPSVDEAYKICKKWFEDPNGILANQDILKNGNHLTNVLEPFSADEKDKIKKFMQENSDATSLQIWKKLQDLVRLREVNEATFKQRMENKVLLKDVAIQYTYPRLDVNVSKQMNHLLKSPFVVHPKTGRVCVPIDPENVNDFDPAKVPTIGQLVEEMHDANAQHTSLKPYLHYFETKFLQELEKTATEELRQRSGVSPGVLMDF